jgi:predicted transcriptional regulator
LGHGYTPESYREAFGLPHNYRMTASNYAETRRALAHKIGLGRKPQSAPKPQPEEAAPKRRGRKPKGAETAQN